MVATAEMISEDLSPAGPPAAAPFAPEALPAREAPAALHGRLLNVSRMATIGEMAAGGWQVFGDHRLQRQTL